MQTLFAICRAGVSEEQSKIRKSLASREFMVARSAPQIPPCQKSGRGTGGGCAVEKTRARARPRSVVGADVSRSPAGCFCRGLLAVRGISRFRVGKFETFSLETAAGSDDYAIFVNRIDPISRNETTSSPPLPVGRRASRCGADRRVRFRVQPARTTGAAARRQARRAARPRTARPAAGDAVV